jgi:hypothetical protein
MAISNSVIFAGDRRIDTRDRGSYRILETPSRSSGAQFEGEKQFESRQFARVPANLTEFWTCPTIFTHERRDGGVVSAEGAPGAPLRAETQTQGLRLAKTNTQNGLTNQAHSKTVGCAEVH